MKKPSKKIQEITNCFILEDMKFFYRAMNIDELHKRRGFLLELVKLKYPLSTEIRDIINNAVIEKYNLGNFAEEQLPEKQSLLNRIPIETMEKILEYALITLAGTCAVLFLEIIYLLVTRIL